MQMLVEGLSFENGIHHQSETIKFFQRVNFVIEAETLAETNSDIILICTRFLFPQSLTITNMRTVQFNH